MNGGTVAAIAIGGVAILGIGYLVLTRQPTTVSQVATGPNYYPPVNGFDQYGNPVGGGYTNAGSGDYDHTREDWETGVAIGTSVVNAGISLAEKLGAFD